MKICEEMKVIVRYDGFIEAAAATERLSTATVLGQVCQT
jgi:hypothetical protein